MSWRTLFFSNPCKLSLKDKNLLYQSKEEEIKIAIDEIGVIILESHQIVITTALLSKLANMKVTVFICDKFHLPNGVLTPFHQHSLYSKNIYLQVDWSEPFKKRVWQKIIKQKISNQAQVLKLISKDSGYKKLINLLDRVNSGDETNTEAYGARLYWKYLFKNFKRNSDDFDIRNMALNYGYAMIRGVISRNIVAVGFLPSFGIHHKNFLNSFNLADDLIEVYRPFIDFEVYKMFKNIDISEIEPFLTKEYKVKLLQVLDIDISIKEKKFKILKSCELVLSSLVNATKDKNYKLLDLPTFSDV